MQTHFIINYCFFLDASIMINGFLIKLKIKTFIHIKLHAFLNNNTEYRNDVCKYKMYAFLIKIYYRLIFIIAVIVIFNIKHWNNLFASIAYF